MKTITVNYKDRQNGKEYSQTFSLSDEAALAFYDEVDAYKGGEIKVDTMLYNLLTACTFLSKLEGFNSTPDFDILPPDWLLEEIKEQAWKTGLNLAQFCFPVLRFTKCMQTPIALYTKVKRIGILL